MRTVINHPWPTASAIDYCRQARRIRCRHAAHTARAQSALHDLARRHDRMGGATTGQFVRSCSFVPIEAAAVARQQPERPGDGGPHQRAHGFVEMVESRLTAGVLRQSERRRLVRNADRLGIGRFEANLIIAAVQHRQGALRIRPERDVEENRGEQRSDALRLILGVMTVQAIVIGTVWWMVYA